MHFTGAKSSQKRVDDNRKQTGLYKNIDKVDFEKNINNIMQMIRIKKTILLKSSICTVVRA